MRPLKLTINAFGPYASSQVFDFQLLGERNLFLITGDIGSGKTTIFDALCCALYGETSGGERSSEEMRSHHALPETLTEITLEFALQGSFYRAYFSPNQMIPKKRVQGFTKQSVQSELYIIDDIEQNSKDAQLIAENIKDTKSTIKGLLGFDVHQFRQVVMLAQGQFRKLLSANSGDRELILKSLVDTEFLSRFEEALKAKESQFKKKVDLLESQIKGMLGDDNREDLLSQREQLHQHCLVSDAHISQAETTTLTAEKTLDAAKELKAYFNNINI